jgi:hypothetical protein
MARAMPFIVSQVDMISEAISHHNGEVLEHLIRGTVTEVWETSTTSTNCVLVAPHEEFGDMYHTMRRCYRQLLFAVNENVKQEWVKAIGRAALNLLYESMADYVVHISKEIVDPKQVIMATLADEGIVVFVAGVPHGL